MKKYKLNYFRYQTAVLKCFLCQKQTWSALVKWFREGLKNINYEHAISQKIKSLKIKWFQHDLSFKMVWDFFLNKGSITDFKKLNSTNLKSKWRFQWSSKLKLSLICLSQNAEVQNLLTFLNLNIYEYNKNI